MKFQKQKMDSKLMRMRRQFSLRNLQKQLNGRTKLSEFGQMIEGETDVDHLLENCEQIDGDEYNELHHQKKGQTKSTEEENSPDKDLDKYKIPSSMIVLNDEEKKHLEYVLLQIGLREVGLA